MKTKIRVLVLGLVSIVICHPAGAVEVDPLSALVTEEIDAARINLNPWGGHLGFEAEIDGDDPRLAALVTVIGSAEPGGGHKCPNRGAVRFRLVGGRIVAVGLLPSHDEGVYELRLYDGDRLEGVYRVQRAALLAALEGLEVPTDDPAFAD